MQNYNRSRNTQSQGMPSYEQQDDSQFWRDNPQQGERRNTDQDRWANEGGQNYSSRNYGDQSLDSGMQGNYPHSNTSAYTQGQRGSSSRNQWSGSNEDSRSYGQGQYGGDTRSNRGQQYSNASYGGSEQGGREYSADRSNQSWPSDRTGNYGIGQAIRGGQSGYGQGGYPEQFGGSASQGTMGQSYETRGSSFGSSGMRSRGTAPKSYKRSDERLTEDLCERLMDQGLDCSGFDVQVKDGVVTLTGEVKNRADKFRAEDIASEMSGVTDVENNLRMGRKDSSRGTESQSSGKYSGEGETSSSSSSGGKSSGSGYGSTSSSSSKSSETSGSSKKY